ncbi:Dienelactone hydrolase [Geosmithia morbida]|uniref:Dienelactone hydrolase n=1 Tax=Geosmithia morbida TaxID=1094350 RepID=A0A9P4YUK5_9HYPO|nr:Dienelactone hydrolase [Geosmithia morbida]KAF4122064.1 Dienelactone hydrolase [Geosmithia morbida]
MASNPPGPCCVRGNLFGGEPKGKLTKLADDKTDAYIATASGPNAESRKNTAILIVTDIFGIWPNSKLIADEFAVEGYTTLVPDLFNGDQASLNPPAGFDIFKWLAEGTGGKNPHTKEIVDGIVAEAIKTLKGQGFTKIGAVGYCFGAKYVVRQAKLGIDVAYVAHPSFVDEEELASLKIPFAIAAAETDTIFPNEKRYQSEEILKKTGVPYQINLYQGVEHGFAVRGDLSKKVVKYAKKSAFNQAIEWFEEFLV